ncbi:MAG: hypothetical protein VW338_15260 [Rhodospirillaceae bacterium]
MPIDKLAKDTAGEILATLGAGPDKSAEVTRTIEKALVGVAKETQVRCLDVVQVCCSADKDLAHKISDELVRKQAALIANLSSMR